LRRDRKQDSPPASMADVLRLAGLCAASLASGLGGTHIGAPDDPAQDLDWQAFKDRPPPERDAPGCDEHVTSQSRDSHATSHDSDPVDWSTIDVD